MAAGPAGFQQLFMNTNAYGGQSPGSQTQHLTLRTCRYSGKTATTRRKISRCGFPASKRRRSKQRGFWHYGKDLGNPAGLCAVDLRALDWDGRLRWWQQHSHTYTAARKSTDGECQLHCRTHQHNAAVYRDKFLRRCYLEHQSGGWDHRCQWALPCPSNLPYAERLYRDRHGRRTDRVGQCQRGVSQ